MSDGDWIQTYTGRQFWPLAPRVEDVDIEDIAHSLSLLCRYNGHCREFYSVAEHSLHVAKVVVETPNWPADYGLGLAALLHDASDAYLADIPRALKPYLTGYHAAKARVQTVIHEALGLRRPYEYAPYIKPIDTLILVDEAIALMPVESIAWHERFGQPLGVEIASLPPRRAEREFLEMFRSLSATAKKGESCSRR